MSEDDDMKQMMASVKKHREGVAAKNASNELKSKLSGKSNYERALDKANPKELITDLPEVRITPVKETPAQVNARLTAAQLNHKNSPKGIAERDAADADAKKALIAEQGIVRVPNTAFNPTGLPTTGVLTGKNQDTIDRLNKIDEDSSGYSTIRNYRR